MSNDELILTGSNNDLSYEKFSIKEIYKVNDYLFLILNNGQKILTNGKEIYDCSEYDYCVDLFNMNDNLCAVFTKFSNIKVVNLNKMEIVFEDRKAYCVSKEDERILHVIMKQGIEKDAIYDIETKRYLQVPDNYEFENSLGKGLYVFRERQQLDKNFYECKRCIINAEGKMVLKDINGWIELSNKHLIIQKDDSLCIVEVNDDLTLNMKTVEQNNDIIARPKYYNDKIIIIEEGSIKIYDLNFKLINNFIVEKLYEVLDYEIIADILKLYLPETINGKQKNRHLFINLNTGKIISHYRIEAYPYWNPTTYLGQDDILDSNLRDYYFYNNFFDLVYKVSANSCDNMGENKESHFIVSLKDDKTENQKLLNMVNGRVQSIEYDYIQFHPSLPYGYGVNYSTQKMDFFDEDLNIIIHDFDYKKLGVEVLNLSDFSFDYFIINNYICIKIHFVNNYNESSWRTIIQNIKGNVILDSTKYKCYAIGNFIQILQNRTSLFLDTRTGEIGELKLLGPSNEEKKLSLSELKDINNVFLIDKKQKIAKLENKEEKKLKVKILNKKYDL